MKAAIRWSLCLLCVVFTLAGCAVGVAPDKLATVRRIAVVSVAGQELHQTYIGFTVFGKERGTHDISSWNLDDAWERQGIEAIQAIGGLEGVRAPIDRKAFRELDNRGGGIINADLVAPNWGLVATPLRSLASATRADLIVVMLPRRTGDYIGRSPQMIAGAGVYARGIGDTTHVSMGYVNATLHVLDARTLETVTSMSLHERRYDARGRWDDKPATRPMGAQLARKAFADWTEDEAAMVRRVLENATVLSWASSAKLLFGKSESGRLSVP